MVKSSILVCLVAATVAVRREAVLASPAGDSSSLVNQITSKADDLFGNLVARARHAESQKQGQGQGQSNSTEIQFDEDFFRTRCDLSEYTSEGFDLPQFKYDATSGTDANKWTSYRKCENPNLGHMLLLAEDNFNGGDHACASRCNDVALANLGEVMCCMHDKDGEKCHAWKGWQGLVGSGYGRWGWWRTPKKARLMFQPRALGSGDLSGEASELNSTSEGQDFVKDLIFQLNAVSIDGILDHLLSFYICMRWVPDAEFVRLAQFELEHVSVDAATPAEGPLNRDGILDRVLAADLTPLRCNSAINVQNIGAVNSLLRSYNDTTSEIHQLYTFVKDVYSVTDPGYFAGVFKDERGELNKKMQWDEAQDKDSVYVKDMRMKARKPENLPWTTFLRSSKDFDHHFSSSDNLFMVCFGPRVASYPHKREGGQHVLADGNMAGCNAFWDIATMKDQLERIKKLFAPEMCFEHTLRKELKNKFLATFVEMNEEFENAMQNSFSKRVHELDPTQSGYLDLLSERHTQFEYATALTASQTDTSYKKIAGILANANAKWVVCPTAADSPTEGFGNEDNFFRNPAAYSKWIGEATDETVPQCKTLDPVTGCVKCIIAVMDKHRCHVRLNVKLDDVFKAVRDKAYPFLVSPYTVQEVVMTETGPVLREVQKEGACMVRKSVATTAIAAPGGTEALKDAFFNVNSTDTIVDVLTRTTPQGEEPVTSNHRFFVSDRISAYERYILDPNRDDSPTDDDLLVGHISDEQYRDKADDWPKKFVFTHEEPEEQNRPQHKVDYFMSCPCTSYKFASTVEHFQQFGGIGMGDYYNFR